MLIYANVNGERTRPFRGGRGSCPGCGGPVVAHCGSIYAHHWKHESKDCDPWSEGIGPWHLSWQDQLRPEFIEVVKGPHRADIVGCDDTVIELQSSPISGEDIGSREQFYKNMVWLFDATYRFAHVISGDRVFFSLGRHKHLQRCTKRVFLDFGDAIVEVEQWTKVLKDSGYGRLRNRNWFAASFFGDRLRDGVEFTVGRTEARRDKAPPLTAFECLRFPTRWFDYAGSVIYLPRGTAYLPLRYKWGRPGAWRAASHEIIDAFPELANGWSKDTLDQMQEFLAGTPMVCNGLLRLLPSEASKIPTNRTKSSMRTLLDRAKQHIRNGRIPILKPETEAHLLLRATEFEFQQYGAPRTSKMSNDAPVDRQKSFLP